MLVKRLDEVALNDMNIVSLAVVSNASEPRRVKPVLETELTFGGVLGLLVGSALAYLINLADKRFRNPDDVRLHLGLPVVGTCRCSGPRRGTLARNTPAWIRRFASFMIREAGSPKRTAPCERRCTSAPEARRTRLSKSPVRTPGDGKTTSAVNLAASIAASGTRVLLVDCDMRRPRCHRLLSQENHAGVSDVVVGDVDFSDAVIKTEIPNFDLLCCGTPVDTPAELLTHPRFDELLTMVRERYDLVVIDSPPLLAVTDGTVIAPRVDGVLLVMRLSRSARESGKRATELLAGLGADVLGVHREWRWPRRLRLLRPGILRLQLQRLRWLRLRLWRIRWLRRGSSGARSQTTHRSPVVMATTPRAATPVSDAVAAPSRPPAMVELLKAIRDKTARIGVVGMGYVGLPLARAFLNAGFPCIGYDLDQSKIEALRSGRSYIKHVASEWIGGLVAKGRLKPTSDPHDLRDADCILICVPTPLSQTRDPDLSYVEKTADQLSEVLRPGQLIILESTTYPGTTRQVVAPRLAKSGLVCGEQFFVAYSPEREDPGNQNFTASTIPKVVGGLDAESLELADALYSSAVVSTVPVSSCEIAEACKILENTYRSVNIAMVNELKLLFSKLDIDIWEVIQAASTKPFGFQAFYPGPGLGGHCIPIDPFYLSWLARRNEMTARFIELAGEINTSMPAYVVQRVAEALNDHEKPVRGSRILILGVAYKRDIDDPRESPSFRLLELLAERGAKLQYSDPHVPKLPRMRSFDVPPLESCSLTPEILASADCVLVATDHSAFDWPMIADHARLIVDTRNAVASRGLHHDHLYPA